MSTTTTTQPPSTCCNRTPGACTCATQAKCSCGKNDALNCTCEKAVTENKVQGPRCSCRMYTASPPNPFFLSTNSGVEVGMV